MSRRRERVDDRVKRAETLGGRRGSGDDGPTGTVDQNRHELRKGPRGFPGALSHVADPAFRPPADGSDGTAELEGQAQVGVLLDGKIVRGRPR